MPQGKGQLLLSLFFMLTSAFSLSFPACAAVSPGVTTEPTLRNHRTTAASSSPPSSSVPSLELIATHEIESDLNFTPTTPTTPSPASSASPTSHDAPLGKCSDNDKGSNLNTKKKALIACLLPFDPERLFSLQRVRPALDLALEGIVSLGLLPDLELHVSYRDSNCSISDGMNEAVNFYATNTADVFFGPTCDYAAAPVARQVRYWGKALVTPGAMAGDFGLSKADMFPLLTRVGTNFNSLVIFIQALMEHFRWGRLKLLYNPDGFNDIMDRYCHIAMDAVHHGLRLARVQGGGVQHDHFKFYLADQMAQDLPVEVGNHFSGKRRFHSC